MIRKKYFFTLVSVLLSLSLKAADKGAISGIVKDKETNESIVGANVIIQGTTTGTATGFDGNFEIRDVKPGKYNLVVSYISYRTVIIENVKVVKENTVQVDVSLETVNRQLGDVVVTAVRKTDTDVSLINSIKASNLVVNGISNEQILKSQDKDASEVIKRIPGITVIDGRFVMVRGLGERYNATWLNNAAAPGSESDQKAFSFDVIPGALIDNILVYKSPAPELPAEFAGAAIQIFTKNISDKDLVSVSYQTNYRNGTTTGDFYKHKGGNLDWLGIDDGSRLLPDAFPSHLNKLGDFNSPDFLRNQEKLQNLGKQLDNDWSIRKSTAIPDQRLSVGLSKKFSPGNFKISNISSINFSNTFQTLRIHRMNYQVYNTVQDKSSPDFDFYDEQYTNTAKTGILHNWALKINENHKIEFRNLLNQTGFMRTMLRTGEEYYSSQIMKSSEYRFMSRTIYSGQLGGEHKFKNDSFKLNWTVGFAIANRVEPDIRRLTSIKNTDSSSVYFNRYEVAICAAPSPKYAGRVFLDLYENIMMGSINHEQKFKIGDFRPELKSGVYIENKSRTFQARLLGYMKSSDSTDIDFYRSPDEIFLPENINNTKGIKIGETSNPSDSYDAGNLTAAGYAAFKIPVTALFTIYTGVRVEKNRQSLNSFKSDNPMIPVHYDNDTVNYFPSANLAYDLNEKSQVRLSYGKTINRPEFREIAPFVFYDFELNAAFSGNPRIKNASIHNFDLRFERYPSGGEILSLGIFYKQFYNPIEIKYVNAGSGLQYGYQNAKESGSMGAELEIKKSLSGFDKKNNFLRYFRNLSFVLNASLIKSKIKFENPVEESDRPMQGQSPYIINAGIFYQNENKGIMISLLYHVIGKRVIAVGQVMQNEEQNIPDTYEMPRHHLDLTLSKKAGRYFQIKGGIQDILNQPFENKQFVVFMQGGSKVKREQTTLKYYRGTYYSIGVSCMF